MDRVLSVAPFVLLAASAWGQQYPFLPVAGSPKSVKSLFEDSRGRLWLGGTQAACFDGTRFFALRDYGFPAAEAYEFSEDPSGAIWIGAESGVYRFANGKVEEVAKGVGVSVVRVSAGVAVAAMGPTGLGVPRNATLYRIQRFGERWQVDAVMMLDSPGPLTLDRSGMLLYPGSGKAWSEIRVEDVARWRPGAALQVIRHPSAGVPDNGPVKVMRDRSGCLWVGVDGGAGYDCGDGNRMALFEGADTRSRIHEGADGTMVLWGDSLLAVGRPGSFRVASRANGLPGIVDAIQGKDGTIWLGTTQGLYRMASPFRVEYWTIRDGVAYAPWSVGRSGGRVYAGLDAGKIVVLDQGRSRWNAVAGFSGRGSVSALLDNGNGTFFVGFRDRGALLLSPDGKVLASTADSHPSVAMRFARTPGGEVWLGGAFLERVVREGSLLRVENHPLQMQPSRNVLAIKYQEQTHKLWACYSGGLVVWDERGAWICSGAPDCARKIVRSQGILGSNLIVNGNAEAGSAGTPTAAIPGWTLTGKANVLPYGVTGYLLTSNPAPADHGFQYFACVSGNCVLTQNIDVSSAASAISGGNVKFVASAFFGARAGGQTAQVTVAFENASGQQFSTATLGPAGYNGDGLSMQQQIGLVPTGTARIAVTLTLGNVYAVADSLSLVLSTLGTNPASVLGTNLVVNGNAESGSGVPRTASALYVPGWSTSDAASVAPYGGTGWIGLTDFGPADRGVNLFCGPGGAYRTSMFRRQDR